MTIIKYRKIWYSLSAIVVVVSLFSVFYFGLNMGIDFTGGSLLEVEYVGDEDSLGAVRPDLQALKTRTEELGFGGVMLQPTGENGLIIRTKDLTEDEHQILLSSLGTPFGPDSGSNTNVVEIRFDSIGPVIGSELRKKSWTAISLVVIMIILYIAFVFRKVSSVSLSKDGKGVSSFKFGLMAIVALIHDVTIPFGVFAVLGTYFGAQIDVLFVTAMLTILGFSVHDTIVVFDRVRENLKKGIGEDFEQSVGISVSQTITRSINTSLTSLFVLVSLFLFGAEPTKYFSLALIIGMIIGTYSSIFLASPLLVTIFNWQSKRK